MKASAVLAGPPASPAVLHNEVDMKALKVELAAKPYLEPAGALTIRRDGKPDLQFKGSLLLEVETEAVEFLSGTGPFRSRKRERRWKKFSLYVTLDSAHPLVVWEQGFSSAADEVTRFSATVCADGAEVWLAMGKIEEIKEHLSALGYPAVERLGGGS